MGKVHGLIIIQFLFSFLAFAMSPSEKGECLCEKENLCAVPDSLPQPKKTYLHFNIFKQTSSHENEEAVCRRMFGMFDDILSSGDLVYLYFCDLLENEKVLFWDAFIAEKKLILKNLFKTFSNIDAFRAALRGDCATMRLYEERSYALVKGLDGVAEETQNTIKAFLDGIEEEVQGILNVSGFNECFFYLSIYCDRNGFCCKQLSEKTKADFYERLSDYLANIEYKFDSLSSFHQDGEKHLQSALEKYRFFYEYVNSKCWLEQEQQSCYFWENLRKKLLKRITDIEKVLNYFRRYCDDIINFFLSIEKLTDDLMKEYCQDERMQKTYGNEIKKYILERQSFLREKLEAAAKAKSSKQEIPERKYWS